LIGELTDVKIEGDRATGNINTQDGRAQPIAFRKTGSGWLISLER